jgi:uncharacterized RDD family membrane protein YckC
MASVPTSGPTAPPPPVWDARPSGPQQMGYGGFWLRVVAYVIDAILLSVGGAVVGGMFGAILAFSGQGQNTALTAGGGYVIGILLSWIYSSLLESSERGATVGKMAVGLRVVTEQGQRLSFLNATGRYFAKYISAVILCIGFIMVAFTDRKRGLHDMIADTLVVKIR